MVFFYAGRQNKRRIETPSLNDMRSRQGAVVSFVRGIFTQESQDENSLQLLCIMICVLLMN